MLSRTTPWIVAVVAAGCTLLKADPAEDTGFLPHGPKLVELRERAPFNGMYYPDLKRFYDRKFSYKHFLIAPIKTEYVENKIKQSSRPAAVKQARIEEAREIARYMREQFVTALKQRQDAAVDVVDLPKPDTLELEMVLAEVNPTEPAVNILGTVAGALVPGGAVIKSLGTGSVAFEGLLRDAQTKEIYVEFRDREKDKRSPFSVKDFSMYAHIREAIQDWSEQFAELAVTPYEHKVDDSSPITLLPF